MWSARTSMMVIGCLCVSASCAHRNDSPTVAVVRANCESRGVGPRGQIAETCDRTAAQAAHAPEADERKERQRLEQERQDEEHESAADERATNPEDVKIAQANQALLACQAHVDRGDFKSASDCWNDHAEDWAVLRDAGGQLNADRMSFDVPTCLASAATVPVAITACVTAHETSDDEVIGKAACLADHTSDQIATSCGPLDLKGFADRIAQLDVVKVKARIDAKAAPIRARRERARAAQAPRIAKEQANAQRCVTNNVYSLIVSVSYGGADSSKLRGCTYKVTGAGRVQTTTRDGWMIVTWADAGTTRAAFRTSKRYIDGTRLLGSETASYVGVRSFQLVDGSNATMLTFKLSN